MLKTFALEIGNNPTLIGETVFPGEAALWKSGFHIITPEQKKEANAEEQDLLPTNNTVLSSLVAAMEPPHTELQKLLRRVYVEVFDSRGLDLLLMAQLQIPGLCANLPKRTTMAQVLEIWAKEQLTSIQ